MSHALQLAGPVVRAATGFHPHQARRKVDEELGNLRAFELLLDHCLAVIINTVNLKHLLGQVDADGSNLHDGRSFCVQRNGGLTPPLLHIECEEGASIPLTEPRNVAALERSRIGVHPRGSSSLTPAVLAKWGTNETGR